MLEYAFLLVSPGLVASVLRCPVLLSGRLRALFRRLPPSRSTVGGYVAVALSLPFLVGTGLVFASVSPADAALSNALVNLVMYLSAVYVGGSVPANGSPLQRAGLDWGPAGYGLRTWAPPIGATFWYVVVFAVPLVFLASVLVSPTG